MGFAILLAWTIKTDLTSQLFKSWELFWLCCGIADKDLANHSSIFLVGGFSKFIVRHYLARRTNTGSKNLLQKHKLQSYHLKLASSAVRNIRKHQRSSNQGRINWVFFASLEGKNYKEHGYFHRKIGKFYDKVLYYHPFPIQTD